MLKQYIRILSLITISITACSNGPEKPKNLISKKEMINILIDAKLLGSANNRIKRTFKEHGLDFNTYVFSKYNIDSTQFAESNAYYTYHIKEYEEIYAKINDSLEALKVKYKALELEEEKAKKIEDSLQAIAMKKDSIIRVKGIKDSLQGVINKDSLNADRLARKAFEEQGVLVKPVSEKDAPSQ